MNNADHVLHEFMLLTHLFIKNISQSTSDLILLHL